MELFIPPVELLNCPIRMPEGTTVERRNGRLLLMAAASRLKARRTQVEYPRAG